MLRGVEAYTKKSRCFSSRYSAAGRRTVPASGTNKALISLFMRQRKKNASRATFRSNGVSKSFVKAKRVISVRKEKSGFESALDPGR